MRRANDIPASIISLRIGVAQQMGAIPREIMDEAGISEELLSNPTNRVTVDQTMKVWEAIINQTNSHDVGLLSGARIRLNSIGVLGYLMMNSDSIAKALEKLCVHQRLVNSIAFFVPSPKGSSVKYALEMKEDWSTYFRYTIDFMIAGISSVFSDLTYSNVHPQEVGFNFPTPENITTYEEFFAPAMINFNCPQAFITYSRDVLNYKIIGKNSTLFGHFEKELKAVLEEHDNQKKYTRKVRDMIQQNLLAEIPKVEDVARKIGVSTRSLQGLLKEENTTYQSLLNEVRKEVSIKHLKNKKFNITDVAFLTGFSDLSVFSRSFKKWTGLTPSQFQLQY